MSPTNLYDYYKNHNSLLMEYSPVIASWANNHDVFLFDFDECMFVESNSIDEYDQILYKIFSEIVKTHRFIAICESHPFFAVDERYMLRRKQITESLKRVGIDYFFLTADYRLWDEKNQSNSTFWPAWYFRQKYWAREHNYQQYKFPKQRRYNFSCCNMSNLRKEKIYNYIECFRRRRSDWYLTIYDHPHAAISKKDIAEVCSLPQEHIDIWNSYIKNIIPEYKHDLLNDENLNPHSTIFLGHTDAYCNLVMEHTMEVECLSEKSFKPFIAEQIPVYVASVGAAQAVSTLGFDMFYDFVDHHQYDFVTSGFVENQGNYGSFTHRIAAVHQTIDALYKTDFRSFITRPSVIARKLKNKEHFYSDAIDHMTIQHLDRLIKR